LNAQLKPRPIAARYPIEEYVAAMHAAFYGKAAGRIV
jgi:hypothetical protein